MVPRRAHLVRGGASALPMVPHLTGNCSPDTCQSCSVETSEGAPFVLRLLCHLTVFEEDLKFMLTENGLSLAKELPAP